MIDELIASQARLTPDAAAVSFDGVHLTYRDLDIRVCGLAADLKARGVGPDVLVALYLERSLELIVAMLGVLRAGGAYVPLDPSHPRARLAHILDDAKPKLILTRSGSRSPKPAFSGEILAVDASAPATVALAPDATPATRSPNDLAYVIYTSGSTGAPKGVAVEHRSVVNMLNCMLIRPGLAPDDVVVAITTPMFDISVLEVFLPLICGARVVVAPDESVRDGAALAALLESVGASCFRRPRAGFAC